ncbi:MAG TPA: glycoside hydrolase family 36 protein [Steroidobacteraceae bacterium]|nr:glycoside hydrolase family 36 protein [Steroidobacteraceae bacterium]
MASFPWAERALGAVAPGALGIDNQARDGVLALMFDGRMRTQVLFRGRALTAFQPSEVLLTGKSAIDTFTLGKLTHEDFTDPRHGAGRRHVITGVSKEGIEKTVDVTFYEQLPGLAVLTVHYRNGGAAPLALTGWRNAAHEIADVPGGFWSFSGATHEDRRDWIQPLKAGFDQRNTLSMAASDYGGGIPMANIWSRTAGLAVGHLEPKPRLLDLPVRKTATGASIAIESADATTLAPGATLSTDRTFILAHTGDHFAPLTQYRKFLAAEGVSAPKPPESAFAPVWCAWGYEREFTVEQIVGTLPKAKDLGFGWAVLDDGWQNNEGDWRLDTRKFPRGDEDMRAFVRQIRAAGMKPRLWIAPLAADPGSDVLHDHADMLLLDEYGSFQKVSWWNALTQCPAYQPTIDYYVALTKKIIGDWGFEGLKLDGQHLNSVAPCYNKAHNHAHPTESVEKLGDFWLAVHRAAREANPEAVVELCPCGTVFNFHNLPATDQYPTSDPLTSWQVRSKGKSYKAIAGAGSSLAGDHVELSDHGDDFASSVGIGAVISTKFTWPKDTDKPVEKLPPGGYLLTPAKEALWRKWVSIYKTHMLPKGEYLGALYDLGFDKPEGHAIAKDGAMYYAFYADTWNGPIPLRGLGTGRWRVRDLFNEKDLGTVDAAAATLTAKFERFLLVRAERA